MVFWSIEIRVLAEVEEQARCRSIPPSSGVVVALVSHRRVGGAGGCPNPKPGQDPECRLPVPAFRAARRAVCVAGCGVRFGDMGPHWIAPSAKGWMTGEALRWIRELPRFAGQSKVAGAID
jgi:hypothetical protein